MDIDPIHLMLWLGTTHGIVSLNLADQTYHTYTTMDGLAENDIHSVSLDQPPYAWFGTHRSGLSRFNTINSTWWTINTGNSHALLSNRINSLTVDADDNLWAGTDLGATMFPQGGMVGGYLYYGWKDCSPAGSLCRDLWSYTVGDIAFAPNGDGWFAIDLYAIGIYPKPGGVAQFDRQNGSVWNTWDMDQGLPTNQAWDIAVDSQGTVWAGTMEGLSRYNGDDSWTSYKKDNSALVTNQVEDLEFDQDDNLWIATHQGVNRISPDGVWDTLTTAEGLPSNYVNALVTFGDNVCFGTDIGLGCLSLANQEWQYFGDRRCELYLPVLKTYQGEIQ